MTNIVNLTWFLAIITFFTTKKGSVYFPALLVLLGLIFIGSKFKNKQSFNLTSSSKIWILVSLLIFSLELIPRIILKEDFLYFKTPKYIFYSIIITILLANISPKLKTYFYSLFFGILGCVGFIFYHKFISDFPKQELNEVFHYFPFHTLASDVLILWATLIALIGIYFYKTKTNKVLIYLTILGIFLAFLGAVLSGGRGSFLLIPPALIILMIYLNPKKFIKNFLKASLLIFAVFTVLYFIPQSNLKNRLVNFSQDFVEYARGNSKTSQGMRIEVYKCGLKLANQSPLYGLGDTKAVLKEVGEKKFCHEGLKGFWHFHNDFIEQYVHYGLLGVVAMALLLFFPVAYGILGLKTKQLNEKAQLFTYSIILLSLGYFFAGLSDKFLLHRAEFNLYLLLQAFLMSKIKSTNI